MKTTACDSSVSDIKAPARRTLPSGLVNVGNSCYLSSVVQLLAAGGKVFEKHLKRTSNPVANELVLLLEKVGQGTVRVLRPDQFIRSLSQNETSLSWEQQDAHEFLLAVLNLPVQLFCGRASGLVSVLSRVVARKSSIYEAKSPFTGVLLNELICLPCAVQRKTRHISSLRVEPFSCVTLSFDGDETISQAVYRHFCAPDRYGDYVNYLIDGTRCGLGAMIQRSPLILPQLLFLHVSLLRGLDFVKDSSQRHLKTELELSVAGHRYRLLGLIVHLGRDGRAGHFVCYRRFGRERWIECNDELIRIVSVDEVLRQRPYILLYMKE
jgi:ubiquitin carboxyl-terminal hydrolase 36/42